MSSHLYITPPSSPILKKPDLDENSENVNLTPYHEILNLSLNTSDNLETSTNSPKKRKVDLVSNEDKTNKYQRIAKKLTLLRQGLDKIEDGSLGKCLEVNHILELLHPKHPRSGALKGRFNLWKKSDTTLSFFEWLGDHPIEPNNRVTYLTPEQREKYHIKFVKSEDGTVRMERDSLHFTSIGERSNHGSRNTAIYVLSLDWKMYAGSHDKRGTFHHSSFLSGAPVLAAGEIKTDESGQIIEITRRSNHYRPEERHLIQFLIFLQINQVDLEKAEYVIYDPEETDIVLERYNALKYLQDHSPKVNSIC